MQLFPEEWLDLVLKVDVLLRLENADGQSLRVAVDVTTSKALVPQKFQMISSRLFGLARRELNIDCHWVVLVNADSLPLSR